MSRLVLLACAALTAAAPAEARLLLTREAALSQIFGERAEVRTHTLFLTEAQEKRLAQRARAPIEGRRVTWYAVSRGDSLAGVAFIDQAVVRTHSQTLLVALDAGGRVKAVEVLAWSEPEDYRPSPRWLELMEGRADPGEVRPGEALPRLAGSTLSARAATAAVRRALALGELVLTSARR